MSAQPQASPRPPDGRAGFLQRAVLLAFCGAPALVLNSSCQRTVLPLLSRA